MNVTMWFIYKFREFIITVTCKEITLLVKGKWGEDFIVIENTLSNGRSIFVWYIFFEFLAGKGRCDFTALQFRIRLRFTSSCSLWTNGRVKYTICFEIDFLDWQNCEKKARIIWYTSRRILLFSEAICYKVFLRYWCETDPRRVYNLRCSRVVYRSLIL